MKISMNTGYVCKNYNSKELKTDLDAAILCKEAGFDFVDCSPNFYKDSDWKEKAQKLAEDFSANKIVVNQTHAPFNRYTRMDEAVFKEYLDRFFEISSIINSKIVVIHADEYVFTGEYSSKDACAFAYDFWAPYVEISKKLGMNVAVENLFEDRDVSLGRTRCCSELDEIFEIITRFNSPNVGCCWDFGHGQVAFGEKMTENLEKIAPLVISTHVHDCNYDMDIHVPPFMGIIDWDTSMKILKKANYQGELTFELVYGTLPDELLSKHLRLMHDIGRFLAK